LREGKVITVVPQTQRLTTQEAADFLGISRPTLVKLLDQEKIPYDQPGRHRRIMFSDLLRYVEQRREERTAALDRMTEDASSAGIYGGRPEDYAAALRKPASVAPGRTIPDVPRYAVVLDACVLAPIALADTLLRIAERAAQVLDHVPSSPAESSCISPRDRGKDAALAFGPCLA
jgi:excisionase family DNA binding protein